MNRCPRCLRFHSGLCGIPPGVTRGFGAHSPGVSLTPSKAAHRKSTNKKSTEDLLAWGQAEYKKVMELLKVLPESWPEQQTLLDRESKLARMIEQIRRALTGA